MTRTLFFLPLLALVACAGPTAGPASLVGPTAKADGNGPGALFVCRIEPGDGDSSFSTDMLRCELPAEATLPAVDLDVYGTDDRHLGSGRLGDGPLELRFFADRYPLRIRAHARAGLNDEGIVGLDGQLRTEMTIASAADLAQRRGPELPFEVWEMRIESGLDLAHVSFDEYELVLASGELDLRGERRSQVSVRPRTRSLGLGDVAVVRLAVPHGTDALTGTAGGDSDAVPFTIDRPGRYRVTRAGLEPEREPPARLEPARVPFLSCYGHGAIQACRVVRRDGITLRSASVVVDGAEVSLPLDGEYADIPEGESLYGRVVLDEGLHGFDLGVIEAPLTPVRYENALPGEVIPNVVALEAPFDLLHAAINVGEGETALFNADAHSITIEGEVQTAQLSAFVTADAPDLWVAVTRDVTEANVAYTLLRPDGQVTELPSVAIRGETLFATPDGLVEPPLADPQDELIGCWIERGDLHCGVSFRDDLEAGSVAIHLDAVAPGLVVRRNLVPAWTSETIPMQDLENLFPITLELRATVAGQAEQRTRVRVLDPADLPEARRVYLDGV